MNKANSLLKSISPALTFVLLAVIALEALNYWLPVRELLRYENTSLSSGEHWRWLSGHFVHVSLSHSLLNAFGLALLIAITRGTSGYGSFALFAALFISTALWFFHASVGWYAGLSGVLHGIFLLYAFQLLNNAQSFSILLITLLIAKLAYEAVFGPSQSSAALIGAQIVWQAHVWGAVAATVYFCLCQWRPRTEKT